MSSSNAGTSKLGLPVSVCLSLCVPLSAEGVWLTHPPIPRIRRGPGGQGGAESRRVPLGDMPLRGGTQMAGGGSRSLGVSFLGSPSQEAQRSSRCLQRANHRGAKREELGMKATCHGAPGAGTPARKGEGCGCSVVRETVTETETGPPHPQLVCMYVVLVVGELKTPTKRLPGSIGMVFCVRCQPCAHLLGRAGCKLWWVPKKSLESCCRRPLEAAKLGSPAPKQGWHGVIRGLLRLRAVSPEFRVADRGGAEKEEPRLS